MTNRTIDIEFGEGKMIMAHLEDVSILTDLPEQEGGSGAAPTPFDLFLSSLATCAAVYARKFCESRSISTDDINIKAVCEMDPEKPHAQKIRYQISLPKDFPEKYKAALLRSIDLCTVKKHLISPPAFELEITG